MKFWLLMFLLSTTNFVCCANSGEQTERFDPLEGFNRAMYKFNYNILDKYMIRSMAIAWRNYVPQSVRNKLINFTNNLEEPAIVVNCFLKGDPYLGMIHFTRFFLNTLLGMGGFIDVAIMANPKLQREQPHRFGKTLGHYGVGYGPYLHLPIYGSFTVRDEGGDIVDTLYPVLSWLTWPFSISKWIIEGIETRVQLLDSDNLLHYSSDPYVTMREAYFQNHDFIANGGKLNQKFNLKIRYIENELLEIDAK